MAAYISSIGKNQWSGGDDGTSGGGLGDMNMPVCHVASPSFAIPFSAYRASLMMYK